jgi:lysophospholipase L1-like esterase
VAEPPVRIVVLGSSAGLFIRPPREHPSEGTYAEVLERELLARGLEVVVTNSSAWTLQVTDALRRIAALVFSHQPRVVVINLGMFEAQRLTIPTTWFRWLYSGTSRGGVNLAVRDAVGPHIVRLYKWMTPRLLARLTLPHRVPPRRFEQELTSLVDNIRKERGADVLLFTISPPSDRIAATLPDIVGNANSYNDIIRRVASKIGANVEVVEVADLLTDLDKELPDGLHFSVEGHRLVGEYLAERIERILAEE